MHVIFKLDLNKILESDFEDDSRVVVAIGKREMASYLKGVEEDGGSRCRANVVSTIRSVCTAVAGHAFHT